MINLQYTRGLISLMVAALTSPSLVLAQTEITANDRPNRVVVAYVMWAEGR
jgi:hypothetical protein